ncbi:MAG: hypothetical protein WCO68_07915, partial [Verrucomicrobiota bacterium]
AQPHVSGKTGAGLKARTISSEMRIVRAFSPARCWLEVLGRCPRLIWSRAFGPEMKQPILYRSSSETGIALQAFPDASGRGEARDKPKQALRPMITAQKTSRPLPGGWF